MHLKLPSVPAYSFPKTGRDRWGNELNPGPGQYEGKFGELSTHKREPRPVMNRAGLEPRTAADGLPGPAEYEVSRSTLSKRGQYIMSHAKREFNLGMGGLPGPGAYETSISSLNRRGFAVAKTGRLQDRKDPLPGPGEYETNKTSFSRRGIAPVKSMSSFRKEATPGPLDYEPYSFEDKSRQKSGIKIPAAPRSQPMHDRTPGPADYAANYSSLAKKGLAPVKSARTIFEKNDTPGPGNYETSLSSLTKKGVARMAPPHAASPDAGGPGPGDYEPFAAAARSHKGVTIPHAARDSAVRDGSPGPANYDSHVALDHLLNRRGAGTAMPKAGALDRIPEVPGPGQYETNRSSLSKVGQAAMPRAPRDPASKQSGPGPADYEPSRVYDTAEKKRGVSFPLAGKETRKDDTPGPGHYEFASTVPNVAPYSKPRA